MLNLKLKMALAVLMNLAAGASVVCAAGQTANRQPTDDPKPAVSGAESMDAWWIDLTSTDDAKASRALLAFAAKSTDSTAFLKERLKPVKADPERFAQLLALLDDDKYAVRAAAVKKLAMEVEYLGKHARPILEQSLKTKISPEVKQRLEEALKHVPAEAKKHDAPPMPPGPPGFRAKSVGVSNVNGKVMIIIDGKTIDLDALQNQPPPAPPRPNAQWLRAVRTVALLETFGTPEARNILEKLAQGEPDAPPTQEAKGALERLAKSK